MSLKNIVKEQREDTDSIKEKRIEMLEAHKTQFIEIVKSGYFKNSDLLQIKVHWNSKPKIVLEKDVWWPFSSSKKISYWQICGFDGLFILREFDRWLLSEGFRLVDNSIRYNDS